MELLWLTENYPPHRGGMAQSCDRIVRSLRERGAIIHLVHFTNRTKPYFTETKLGGTYTAVPVFPDVAHTLHRCLNFLTNPDRPFQFMGLVAFGGILVMSGAPVYAKLFEVPLFTLLRGNDFDVAVFSPRRKYYLDQLLQTSDWISVNSMDKARRIKHLYPNTPVHYIPNGINDLNAELLPSEKAFAGHWKQEQVQPGQRVIGLFGNLKAKKGVLFFLQSLIRSGQKGQVHLLFIGELELEEPVQDLLQEQEIDYTLLPFMDRSALLKYYLVCDWIAIPSFYEGMPNVLMEAGSMGVPVLASNIDGMKDILVHEENGLLFHPSDWKACSACIHQAVRMSEEDRKALGEQLREKTLVQYSIEAEAEQFWALFSGKSNELSSM